MKTILSLKRATTTLQNAALDYARTKEKFQNATTIADYKIGTGATNTRLSELAQAAMLYLQATEGK